MRPARKTQLDEQRDHYLGGYELREYQVQARRIAREKPRFGFFWDAGVGKTPAAEAIIWDSAPCRALVLCPLSLIKGAWIPDIRKFLGPDFPVLDLHDVPTGKRWKALERFRHGIVLLNYDAVRLTYPVLADERWDILILDESSRIKNHETKTSKFVRQLAEQIPRVYLLSATPAPNSELEYYPQGKVLGVPWPRSYYAFRNLVARPGGYMGYRWQVTPQGRERIMRDLSPYCWHLSKDEALDLPDRTFIDRRVTLSRKEREVYDQMCRHMVVEIIRESGGIETIAVRGVLPKLAKLRQATSGFMYGPDGAVPVVTPSSKMEALLELLEEIGNQQVVVWINYREEAQQIRYFLGGRIAEYHGEVSPRHKQTFLEAFQRGDKQYLVANPQSIGHGVTLTNCSYMIWFSLLWSWECYHQGNDRIYRFGQRNTCTYYHLLVPDSIDELMLSTVQNKEVNAREFLRFLQRSL